MFNVMEEKLNESMKKRARSPTPQQGEETKRDDGHSRAQHYRAGDHEMSHRHPPGELYPTSSANNDLVSEYRLLLARQETLREQIRLIESRLSLRRMEAALGPGRSSHRDANDASILERVRQDLLNRENQALIEGDRSSHRPMIADSLHLLQEQRDRELLLSRLPDNPSQGLPDQLLSMDQSRQLGGLSQPSVDTLEELMAARSRGHGNHETLLRRPGLSRNRLEEAPGQRSPQRQGLSPPRFTADSIAPTEQLLLLQQIERQRRVNDALLLDQARGIDGGSSHQLPSSGSQTGVRMRDMRGSPAARDFKAGVPMAVDSDGEKLSAFQALIRRSLEYFEATEDDVVTSVQGRRQKIRLGQIGVRCRYCSHLPIRSMARAKGAVYYPKTMISVYQAAQNIANSHFLVPCNFMPEEVQKELAIQRPKRDASLAGKPYWTKTCQELGIYEEDDALWHRESKKSSVSERML